MHFGKKISAFLAEGGLRCVDYKALKRIIKSGNFSQFWDAMVGEIEKVTHSVNSRVLDIEIQIGMAQLLLMKRRLLFTEIQLQEYRSMFAVPDWLSDAAYVDDLVEIFEDDRDGPEEGENSMLQLVADVNHLIAFLEINACGFRKIAKKFSKRSGNTPTPKYMEFFNKASFTQLVLAVSYLKTFGAPAVERFGEELTVIVDSY